MLFRSTWAANYVVQGHAVGNLERIWCTVLYWYLLLGLHAISPRAPDKRSSRLCCRGGTSGLYNISDMSGVSMTELLPLTVFGAYDFPP